jgi:hypothetical protein
LHRGEYPCGNRFRTLRAPEQRRYWLSGISGVLPAGKLRAPSLSSGPRTQARVGELADLSRLLVRWSSQTFLRPSDPLSSPEHPFENQESPKVPNIGHSNSTPTDAVELDCAKCYCRISLAPRRGRRRTSLRSLPLDPQPPQLRPAGALPLPRCSASPAHFPRGS